MKSLVPFHVGFNTRDYNSDNFNSNYIITLMIIMVIWVVITTMIIKKLIGFASTLYTKLHYFKY